jgi:hypothetical protein
MKVFFQTTAIDRPGKEIRAARDPLAGIFFPSAPPAQNISGLPLSPPHRLD